MTLVVDASIAVKALTNEPGSHEDVLLIAGAAEPIAPTFIRLEVASALAKKVRLAGLPREHAAAALTALDQFLPTQVAIDPLIGSAMMLSLALNNALFDCLYLALAIERDGVVATADLNFERRHGMLNTGSASNL